MLRLIGHESGSAFAAARRALQGLSTDSDTIDTFVCSNRALDFEESVEGNSDKSKNKTQYAKGLPWLCTQLNQQSSRRRRLIFFPLDPGHPLGNHVAVDYNWTLNDVKLFEDSGSLPIDPFDFRLQDHTCIVLRFQDLHSRSRDTYPVHMRGLY